MGPREILEAFDRYLADRGLGFDAVVVGGAALNLLGIISRATILDPPLPSAVVEAARSLDAELRRRGEGLQDDWLNNGPASLTSVLPPGWRDRLQLVFSGTAIQLRCLGRDDLLRSKLLRSAIAASISETAWRSRPRPRSYARSCRGWSCRTGIRAGQRTCERRWPIWAGG